MKPVIIALNGVRGSGKDTVGGLMASRHGYRLTSFAAPLKAMVRIAFPFTDEQLYGPSSFREVMLESFPLHGPCLVCSGPLERVEGSDGSRYADGRLAAEHFRCMRCHERFPLFINARIALKALGTEWGRRLFKNIWADAALEEIQRGFRNDEGVLWVLTDCRFISEISAVRGAGGAVVRLLRGWDEAVDATHSSELEMRLVAHEDLDYCIDNRGPLEELPALVDEMLRVVLPRLRKE